MQNTIFGMILNAGLVVKGVMLLLLAFSVISWSIIFYKFLYLMKAKKENLIFIKAADKARNTQALQASAKTLEISPIANVFMETLHVSEGKDRQEIRRALKRFETLEAAKLERHLSFLATTGSTTPFIGLFGTVWGIMSSFMGIGSAGSASLAVVAPGIAEALIATAMGLCAAIPAVMAYNYYLSSTRRLIIEMEDFSEELLNLFAREINEG